MSAPFDSGFIQLISMSDFVPATNTGIEGLAGMPAATNVDTWLYSLGNSRSSDTRLYTLKR